VLSGLRADKYDRRAGVIILAKEAWNR